METKMKNNLSLDELLEKFTKSGNLECESVLVDSNADKKMNYVSIWSNKSDVSKIIKRCRNDIKDYEIVGDGVMFRIDRKAFRGIQFALRRTRVNNEGKRKAAAERMKKYWEKKKQQT